MGWFAVHLAKGGSGGAAPTPAVMVMVVGIFVGMAAIVVMAAVIQSLHHRRRRLLIADSVRAMGLESVDVKSKDASFIVGPMSRRCGEELNMCSVGILAGRAARLAEFTLWMHGGRRRWAHHHLQVSLECPESWPAVRLWTAPGPATEPVWEVCVGPGGITPDVAFHDRWRLTAQDMAFISDRLTPALRAEFLNGPRYEFWSIQGGWLTCTWRKACRREDLAPFVARAQAVHAGLTEALGT